MTGRERFTQKARRVLSFAHHEAERAHHNTIGPEHLLIGLMQEKGGVASRVLRELGLADEEILDVSHKVTTASPNFDPDRVELGPQAQQVLEYAVDEARRLGHHYIGTEHILLGLVLVDSTATEILARLGVTAEQIRKQTRRVLNERVASRPTLAPESLMIEQTNQVLILDGRDIEAMQTVAAYIKSLGLEVVRSDQKTSHQIDIFVTDVDFVVALLTADDLVESKSQSQITKFHASQNVIYALGFFRGKLGYKRICALFKSDPKISVELPTESFRVVYVPFDSGGTWKLMLSKQMQAAGIIVDSGSSE